MSFLPSWIGNVQTRRSSFLWAFYVWYCSLYSSNWPGKMGFFYYSVTSEEFVITVNYDKEKLEHKIGEYVPDIIKEAQKKSDLYRWNWAVHWPLCEEIEDSSSYFLHSVVITITVNLKKKKKKKMSLLMIFNDFKKECKIKKCDHGLFTKRK